MLIRRLLALAVAIGLVLGAWQVRARLLEPSGAAAAPDDLRVACARELAAVCDALDTSSPALVEEARTTVERFAEPDLPFDVWLTLAPWPELGAAARARANQPEVAEHPTAVVARSPVILAAHSDRITAMEDACDGAVTWRCLGDQAGVPWVDRGGEPGWGRVKVGLDSPSDRAVGLLTLLQVTSSYFDGADFNTRSLESPDYFAWISNLAARADAPVDQTPLERMLLTGSAELEFVGVLEATAVSLLERAPGRAGQIVLRRPEPVVTADVVAVGYGAGAQAAAAEIAAQAAGPLADAGWRVAGVAQPSELETAALPENNGVPSAAVLEALQRTWDEVTP